MFELFVIHPFGTFNVKPLRAFQDLDSAIACAFDHIAAIVPDCSVWIESNGAQLRLMN